MASASTINAWIDELVSSFATSSPPSSRQQHRKIVDTFRRRIRHHGFARTNQFDVRDRLIGLEEKFQVLNRDDLSDALHARRSELRDHYERWIPDILDLLLRLSDNPLQADSLSSLHGVTSLLEASAPLAGSDLVAEGVLDRDDPIWRAPEFSDLSSDEDKIEVSTNTTSPASVKQRRKSVEVENVKRDLVLQNNDVGLAEQSLKHLCGSLSDSSFVVTEIQFIRNMLLMAQGYPTTLFPPHNGGIILSKQFHVLGISGHALRAAVGELNPVRNDFNTAQIWVKQHNTVSHVQVMKQLVENYIQRYVSSVCLLEERMLYPQGAQVASILETISHIRVLAIPLAKLARLVQRIGDADPIAKLDILYQILCEDYSVNDSVGYEIMLVVFLATFKAYIRPISTWLKTGSLLPITEPFFVRSKTAQAAASSLWTDWFELDLTGQYRPPRFFSDFAHDIFACGKTVAFISHLGATERMKTQHQIHRGELEKELHSLSSNPQIPFPTAFSSLLQTYTTGLLSSSTVELKQLLESRCGINNSLDAFEHVYLRKQGVLLDVIETRIFNRIDQCKDNWNDRFLVTDMLEDVYGLVSCVDLSSITVHSVHTSSRSMESRRRSVRILSALALDYTLPWPIANIIPKTSMAAYRRVALHLLQIRRVKYLLDRTAFAEVRSTPISENQSDQLLAQTTTFMLIQFINTLYDHFTTSVTLPLTQDMREHLRDAATVDTMIAVHKSYITDLEFACLTAKQLKVLRDALIGLLDMCIRFTDLVCSAGAKNRTHTSADLETDSFVSARSRRKRHRNRATGKGDDAESSDGEDEDEENEAADGYGGDGEGYSSFIVLEEDMTIAKEIRKLQSQFRRQLDFFVAGLKGVGRGGGNVETFELLADRLAWKGTDRRHV